MIATPAPIGDLGGQLAEALLVLLLTAAALVVARLSMRRWLGPALHGARYAPDRRALSLVELVVYLAIAVFGLHRAVRVVAPEIRVVEDLFFLLYWLLGVYVAYRLVSAAADWSMRGLAPRSGVAVPRKLVRPVKYVLYVVVLALAFLVLMDYFGITSAALTTSLAALGVTTLIVGLAAENIINDIISGYVIGLDQPFREGDRIEILELDTWGDVQEVGWRSTRILTLNKRMVTIPNSLIGRNLVTNYSIPNKFFRVETDVLVSYGEPIELVRGLVLEAVEEQDWVVRDRPIQVLLWEFRESCVVIRARCWIEDYVDTRVVVDRLNTAIYRRLFEEGVVSAPVSEIVLHRAGGGEKRRG